MNGNALAPLGSLLLATALAACASTTAGQPAASAGALGPGFALEEGDHVVENPGVHLSRTYWSVVRASDGAHYLLPRPDGAGPLASACQAGDGLAAKLAEHALCSPAETEAAVAKINALDESLALEVSTVLHSGLRFERVGDAIQPAPLSRDLLAVCRSDAGLRDGAMKARCADEEKYADGGPRPAIFMAWSDAELEAVPKALNGLYGI